MDENSVVKVFLQRPSRLLAKETFKCHPHRGKLRFVCVRGRASVARERACVYVVNFQANGLLDRFGWQTECTPKARTVPYWSSKTLTVGD